MTKPFHIKGLDGGLVVFVGAKSIVVTGINGLFIEETKLRMSEFKKKKKGKGREGPEGHFEMTKTHAKVH